MANDLIRLVFHQIYQNKHLNNVFYFKVDGTDNNKAEMVAKAFETQYLTTINQIQNISCVNFEGYALNLTNPADYWTEQYLGNGLNGVSQSGNPPFVTISYTINPVASIIRHGYKRFGGVDEAYVSAGNLSGSFLPEVNAVATMLTTPLELTPLLDAIPVIVRILSLEPTINYISANVATCVFRAISTQNTRKK